jgi:hypothetical protein
MKILFTLIACLFFLSISLSQIILSKNDFASTGDTVRLSQTNQISNDYSLTGPGFNWDFSSLVQNSQFVREFTAIGFSPVQLTFGILAPQVYQASYFIPENTLPLDQLNGFLPVSLSDARSYQRSTADSITKVGFSVKVAGIDVAFKSDTIETKYKFPMNYQQTFTTKGYTFIDLNPAADFKVKQYRNVTSTVDGYGQLTLPIGIFDVLRLKREINEIDSVYQSFFGVPSWFAVPPFQTTEYEWIGQNKKDVLLKIVVSNTNGIDQIQSIEYQDIFFELNNGITENDFQASVFPNPTSNGVQIHSNVILKNIRLFDSKGIILERQIDMNTLNSTLDLGHLSSGIYFLKLENASGSKTIRVTKN